MKNQLTNGGNSMSDPITVIKPENECRRNGKQKLVWIADREKALAYTVKPDEMLLTVHRWFARKSCPGNWLFGKLGDLADVVNRLLGV